MKILKKMHICEKATCRRWLRNLWVESLEPETSIYEPFRCWTWTLASSVLQRSACCAICRICSLETASAGSPSVWCSDLTVSSSRSSSVARTRSSALSRISWRRRADSQAASAAAVNCRLAPTSFSFRSRSTCRDGDARWIFPIRDHLFVCACMQVGLHAKWSHAATAWKTCDIYRYVKVLQNCIHQACWPGSTIILEIQSAGIATFCML